MADTHGEITSASSGYFVAEDWVANIIRETDSAQPIEVNCQSSTCCGAFVGGTAIEIELWSIRIDCLQEHPDDPFRIQYSLAAGIAPQSQTDRGDQQLESLSRTVSITLFLLCTVPVPVLLIFLLRCLV